MHRRDFLRRSLIGSLALPFGLSALAEETAAAPRKFVLSAPLTHSDWMLKPGVAWGAEGVHHMLDMCKAGGWSRIYWRVTDGGRSLYHSKLMKPMGAWDTDGFWSPQTDADKALFQRYFPHSEQRRKELLDKFAKLDYAHFDPFAEAVRYGHKIGLQIHAWVTINEDDHGWGLTSEFAKKHPEYRWHKRDGTPYHSQLSFAFPEVRKYKLAIVKELLANYELDGLFLDWIRTGDVRDNPQNDAQGVANYGYEKPLIERFRSRFKKDPRDLPSTDESWARLRAEPQTEFMREVRKVINKHKRKVPIAAMVGHPWHYRGEMDKIDGSLRGLLLDVNTWAREGLVDSIVAAGYYRDGGNAEMAAHALKNETDRKVDVWTYAWVPNSVADVTQTFATAEAVDAAQILFWEADYIDDRGNSPELKAAMSKRAVF